MFLTDLFLNKRIIVSNNGKQNPGRFLIRRKYISTCFSYTDYLRAEHIKTICCPWSGLYFDCEDGQGVL